jgi:hypothetical protein
MLLCRNPPNHARRRTIASFRAIIMTSIATIIGIVTPLGPVREAKRFMGAMYRVRW